MAGHGSALGTMRTSTSLPCPGRPFAIDALRHRAYRHERASFGVGSPRSGVVAGAGNASRRTSLASTVLFCTPPSNEGKGSGMEMDATIVALRRFEEAEKAYTGFTGNLLESGATITPDSRAQAKTLRETLDKARGDYHEALRESGRMVPFTH